METPGSSQSQFSGFPALTHCRALVPPALGHPCPAGPLHRQIVPCNPIVHVSTTCKDFPKWCPLRDPTLAMSPPASFSPPRLPGASLLSSMFPRAPGMPYVYLLVCLSCLRAGAAPQMCDECTRGRLLPPPRVGQLPHMFLSPGWTQQGSQPCIQSGFSLPPMRRWFLPRGGPS